MLGTESQGCGCKRVDVVPWPGGPAWAGTAYPWDIPVLWSILTCWSREDPMLTPAREGPLDGPHNLRSTVEKESRRLQGPLRVTRAPSSVALPQEVPLLHLQGCQGSQGAE